ncbi:MAG: hypothetical protein CO031_01985 [Candidatus Nealsonbacteria bacterium CG_4_9_14_0_2_um_filter_37_38]|uniref:Major facilitator superfamily (MFS) profile domain-containing protein n=1 Tax=Candidatus Nealsonbacteria bacterium CG_4_10_14_0_8_um_filter_37_14 TaxID=1974684 RepID=A0A2M7R5Z8_9BACT|nr:MAG: hypothetical protein COV63_03390 [Candidatus Nealsonbacteria bacterium CG11_big_fil_rev_8_21_14_0_20_37_68]PIW92061.1 MAG: hypothetical protein COZ89_02005 [Candidatus Nealsonbacteria bacterium CG_4_8_14_3_um_filter_37_23]PIY88912.1 MAG: hypothetical protein COY73_02575 [Candidatus Nealsonbacteria bacterium CG_4_10_14_0_8_um_filter_37_14]PJC51581.1 MAG: hypothetical protein CO031_01985 [Candidatus Nealsonbacteria bacterium CG_4_9_14_0_2_um_filter_37_38]
MLGIKINRIVKYLVLSDLVFWAGWGLVTPVFAIFIIEKIEGGSAFVAGMSAAIYWILMSFLRIPIGIFLDTCPGERDDYWFLTVGLFIAALVPFGFIFASTPLHIYLLQAVHAVGIAMSLSGWSAIFTRHIDKGQEATEWGIDATSVGFGTGISGAIGGWAVTQFGFNPVFIAVGILGLIGAALLFCIRNNIKGVFDHGLHFSFKEIFQKEEKI